MLPVRPSVPVVTLAVNVRHRGYFLLAYADSFAGGLPGNRARWYALPLVAGYRDGMVPPEHTFALGGRGLFGTSLSAG
jgi:hypothetical protein